MQLQMMRVQALRSSLSGNSASFNSPLETLAKHPDWEKGLEFTETPLPHYSLSHNYVVFLSIIILGISLLGYFPSPPPQVNSVRAETLLL